MAGCEKKRRKRIHGKGIICIYCSTDQSRFRTHKEHRNLYLQTEQYSTKQDLQTLLYDTEESTLSVLVVSCNKVKHKKVYQS